VGAHSRVIRLPPMIAPPARLELALAPTPILKLDRLSRRLGVEVHVKRDDLTGLLESGNKIRKLEFLVGEALQQGADTLITCGTPQSNGCRAVAAVAARLGLRAVLAIRGARPTVSDGNLLLGRLLGADTRYYPELEREMEIVRLHAPELPEALARRMVEVVRMVRALDLKKPPSIAESIDWARTLLLMGAEDIDRETFEQSMSIIVKHRTDIELVAERVGVKLAEPVRTEG